MSLRLGFALIDWTQRITGAIHVLRGNADSVPWTKPDTPANNWDAYHAHRHHAHE